MDNVFFITAKIQSVSDIMTRFDSLAVIKGILNHESDVLEAGMLRHIKIEIPFKVIGALAQEVHLLHHQELEKIWGFKGFWALKHYKNKFLIYHIQDYKK